MQDTHTWYQQYLHRQQSLIVLLIVFIIWGNVAPLKAQFFGQKGNRNSGAYAEDVNGFLRTEKYRLTRPVTFGFYLAGLGTRFGTKLTEEYAQGNDPAGIVSISPRGLAGFGVGFYSSFRLSEFFDLRLNTQASFYERNLEYTFADGNTEVKLVEGSSFEIPILIKYRSKLRGKSGMYMVAGLTPSFALSRPKEERDAVLTTTSDIAIEYGFGLDVFFSYFRFAPEIRFSHGLSNVLNKEDLNNFNRPLERLTTHRVTLFLHFGG